jgi:hypothetical protein
LDYIHYNPVKHGLVKKAQDWPWSSFHRYVGLGYYDKDWGERIEGVTFQTLSIEEYESGAFKSERTILRLPKF